MKRMKLLTMAMAGMLAVAQLSMPVAAADGGSIEVDVTTKTGVLRVEVPTKLAVAVNQFEIGDRGSQIASEEFNIINRSEMPVKVKVDSTVTLGEDVSLVATREAAQDSTSEDGEVWLAAAVAATTEDATVSGGDVSGGDVSGGDYSYDYDDPGTTDVAEGLGDLTETSTNVGTFATDKKLSQSFYLNKGTMDAEGEDPVYKVMVPKEAAKANFSYAKFYELTADGSITNEATLRAKLTGNTVIYELNASNAVINVYDKDDAGTATYTGGNSYCTAAENETAKADLVTTKKYLYTEMKNPGGMTSFRYIGQLGAGRETWTAADISKIVIAYEISGVTETRYSELDGELVNGLHVSEEGIFSFTELSVDHNEVVVTGVADAATVTKVVVKRADGSEVDITANTTGAATVSWLTKEGSDGARIFKVSASIISNANNAGSSIEVTFSDGKKGTLTIPAAE